jgi:hypothetical protein
MPASEFSLFSIAPGCDAGDAAILIAAIIPLVRTGRSVGVGSDRG